AAAAASRQYCQLGTGGASHCGQGFQRRSGAVELPAAMVRHDHAVTTDGCSALGILRALDPFEQELPRPEAADALDRVPVESRVHLAPDRRGDVGLAIARELVALEVRHARQP